MDFHIHCWWLCHVLILKHYGGLALPYVHSGLTMSANGVNTAVEPLKTFVVCVAGSNDVLVKGEDCWSPKRQEIR